MAGIGLPFLVIICVLSSLECSGGVVVVLGLVRALLWPLLSVTVVRECSWAAGGGDGGWRGCTVPGRHCSCKR